VLNKLKPWLLGVTADAENVENVLRLREWQETLVSLTHLANKYKASWSGGMLQRCARRLRFSASHSILCIT